MPATETKPIEDSVAKVDGEVAVGEDLAFQRKWWKFERAVWIFFTLILILDLAGAFGRGPLSHTQRAASDGSLNLRYERIERAGTPSILTVDLGPAALRDGKATLFVSESVVKELGAQRVIPSPETTVLGNGGLTYTFPASGTSGSVQFALQPSGPGLRHILIRAAGAEPVRADILVFP